MKDISKYNSWKKVNTPEEKFENAFLMGRSAQLQMTATQGGRLVASLLQSGSGVFRAVLQKQAGSLLLRPAISFTSAGCSFLEGYSLLRRQEK